MTCRENEELEFKLWELEALKGKDTMYQAVCAYLTDVIETYERVGKDITYADWLMAVVKGHDAFVKQVMMEIKNYSEGKMK